MTLDAAAQNMNETNNIAGACYCVFFALADDAFDSAGAIMRCITC